MKYDTQHGVPFDIEHRRFCLILLEASPFDHGLAAERGRRLVICLAAMSWSQVHARIPLAMTMGGIDRYPNIKPTKLPISKILSLCTPLVLPRSGDRGTLPPTLAPEPHILDCFGGAQQQCTALEPLALWPIRDYFQRLPSVLYHITLLNPC